MLDSTFIMENKICELELKVLYEISRIIGQVLNLDQALETILGILSDSLAMKRATVTLKDEETGHLLISASHGLSTTEKKRGVYRQNEGVTGLIFRTAEPFVVPDISREPLFLNKTKSRRIEKDRISFLGVPIKLHTSPIGVLSVDRLFGKDISFEEDIRFLSIVATLIAQFVSINRQVKAREEVLRKENISLRAELSERFSHFFMIAKSRTMIEVQEMIKKVAPSKASVLLLGESGTGKTLIARIIHELSTRAKYPFVKVNCTSLPENLLESELFGYEKGAFTGAVKAKVGRFEEADGGTIFLDEIGELSLALQSKLLRFLQEREFERLGSTKTIKVDVRIIAATNKDLSDAVNTGSFREDLYYRLNVFPIHVPPLRDRKEDIPSLLDHFIDKISKEYGRRYRITPQGLDVLTKYDWPGNVREMENLIERLAILVDGVEMDVKDLPSHLYSGEKMTQLDKQDSLSRLEEMEKKEVVAALERNKWIQSQAARELGLTLRQIGYRIKKFGLDEFIDKRRQKGVSTREKG
ncbi:Nif-specific regulatory protein [Desulforhabdus amnigena]|uniref:Nif-specific regulatory protein n=2 Tax=Desulforhabdus amnigena TaxID=40218 RepID=A0A9W6D559_9BACT|nr:sigma 54-interacting transcriptional regulator [Desulforhabdus amnigena]GLI34377.1 Nif-specific regulatory protein [Desulforhabdus amnigena]